MGHPLTREVDMVLEITYCVAWNYLPRATGLAAEIRKQRSNIETKLTKGTGGQFEVVLDGTLLFSKKQQGRFPDTQEILQQIPAW